MKKEKREVSEIVLERAKECYEKDNGSSCKSLEKSLKIDEDLMKSVCEMYDLTLIEAKILVFLKNNPSCDTAADIVEYRMLSKGNVSQAVDSLIRKRVFAEKTG